MKLPLKLVRSFGKCLAKGVISAYRYTVSPFLPPSCRYLPTCSEYAWEAIDRHGLGRGITLGLWRILRCHPFGGCGYDPVPQGKHPIAKYLGEGKGI